ncbi:MAG TPA: RNA methyltransferase [Opitutaceae bacterium]|nr:RNA methyltransferase [Opitutaceae bacterium]
MLPAAEIKRLQRLRDDDRFRRNEGVFIVEGDKAVREFVDSGRFRGDLYVTPEWAGWRRDGTARDLTFACHETSAAEMARISHLPSPSSVLAVLAYPTPPLLDLAQLRSGFTLALDAVQDPGNVGTIIRVADWYGFDRVLLGDGCADPFSQKVVNASKGSLARAELHRVELPAVLAAAGAPVLGCDLDGADLHQLAAPAAAIVVIGSEGRGLSAPVRATLTQRVTIPAFGRAESLNAAVAAAIVCDNLRRLAAAKQSRA